MRILLSGASGLIGSAFAAHCSAKGHEILRLVRHPISAPEKEIYWNPMEGVLEPEALAGADAIVHLAGENIANARWSAEKKKRILASREAGTRLISETLAAMDSPPPTLLSASAIGFYGTRGDEELDESSAAGQGFLAEVCQAWEGAVRPAQEAGIRVVCLRIGIVLAQQGGALTKMLPPFKLGLGGRIGDGKSYMSWITLEDVVAALMHALQTDSLSGPVNAVSPTPVTNAVFSKALGRALKRPAILPTPKAALRLLLGEMADEMILASVRAYPKKLLESGFCFADPEIDSALKRLL